LITRRLTVADDVALKVTTQGAEDRTVRLAAGEPASMGLVAHAAQADRAID
jgi:hypothetical protein